WKRVLVGCLAAAALAVLVDATLALIESGFAVRSRQRLGAGLGILIAALAMTLMSVPDGRAATGPLAVIGAKNFSEQYILAQLIEDRLRGAGYRTQRRDNLGSAIAYR